jgi:hypothetical protein
MRSARCVGRWYVTYKLSYRDLAEMIAERHVDLAHTTIMRWGNAMCRNLRSSGNALPGPWERRGESAQGRSTLGTHFFRLFGLRGMEVGE